MDVALSANGKRVLRIFFGLLVVFLYAPIAILLIFSFNNSELPTIPLSGFTLHWYHQFLTNSDLKGALKTSAIIAALSSAGAVVLGVLASIALTRRRFRVRAAVSALLLSPLVIPYVVFGISHGPSSRSRLDTSSSAFRTRSSCSFLASTRSTSRSRRPPPISGRVHFRHFD